jgi:hypothetical protein
MHSPSARQLFTRLTHLFLSHIIEAFLWSDSSFHQNDMTEKEKDGMTNRPGVVHLPLIEREIALQIDGVIVSSMSAHLHSLGAVGWNQIREDKGQG